MNPMLRVMAFALIAAVLMALSAQAQPSSPKPVPRMQVVPQPYDQVSFQRDGVEITRYHFATNLNRPFLFPVIGPSGRSVTRMGHPQDPADHSHHNSIWFSHHDVDGVSFWEDKGRGRVIHQRILRFHDGDEEASLVALNAWMAADGTVLMNERRRISAQWLPDAEWLLVIDVELSAVRDQVTLGKTPFGLLGVRLAKTIGVNDGGGMIRNSAGAVNEKEVFWKPARWVDYSGPVTPTAMEGIALLDHPRNPNHPSVYHVRNDGWMGASFTFNEPRVLKRGEPLTLRYGFYIHRDLNATNAIEKRWEAFSKTTTPKSPALK